ncbi:MAG: protoheme IX farnesyltransferase [Phycisphaerae bacterium]|nr:protoheme IX farnesyltransferase [Phycisphaerae bacterium]
MAEPIATPSTDATTQTLPSIYATLTKIRLSMLVVVTTGVGFITASAGPLAWGQLFWTLLGTLACACSASGLNQVVEARRDAMMDRTRNRPMPTGAITPQHGWIFSMLLGYAGLCLLVAFVPLPAAGLALLTMVIYVLLYTPMKSHTTLNTLVGSVVGAIPPMIGWVAAGGSLTMGAWILAALLFVWQLPHFLSLAWLYREEYAGAGFKMLPGIRGGERITCEVVLLSTLLLVPLGLTATMVGLAGIGYAIVSLLLGIGFLLMAFSFFRRPTRTSARRVFLASLLYLPILLAALVIDHRSPPPASGILTLEPVPDTTAVTPARSGEADGS